MFTSRSDCRLPLATNPALPEQLGLSFALPAARRSFFVSAHFGSMTASSVESHTGAEFPGEFCHRTKTHCPTLTGLGIRAKRLLGIKNINVYALGLYVDAPLAKKALASYKGKPVEELVTNQKLFDDVINSDKFDKTLRLVITFGHLSRDKFLNALDERLKPALKQEGASDDTLSSFRSCFDGVEFKKGMEIAFCQVGKDHFTTKVEGVEKGTIISQPLCKAMFGLYLGPDPVSSDAKSSIGKGLAAIFQ